MYCQRCGCLNSNDTQYCSRCGSPLNDYVNRNNSPPQTSNSSGNNTTVIIVCVTLLLVVLVLAGTFLLLNNNNDNNVIQGSNQSGVSSSDTPLKSQSPQSTENTQNDNSQGNSNNPVNPTTPLEIRSGSFYTGSSLSDKTKCNVYVGVEHAGEKVKISVLYSRDGSNLNQGKIVPVTVDKSGYVTVSSADAFKYYPDNAYITLYDSNGNVQDTRNVYMDASGGTQSF